MRHRLLDVYFCQFSVQQESLKSWLISRERVLLQSGKRSHCTAWQTEFTDCVRNSLLLSLSVSFPRFIFVGIFPCLCLYRFLGFVSVIRLSSRRPYPLQRRKQRHSYHKHTKNYWTEQHNSHLKTCTWSSRETGEAPGREAGMIKSIFPRRSKPTWTSSRCSNWWQPTKCRRTSWLNSWWLPRYLPGKKCLFSTIFSIFNFFNFWWLSSAHVPAWHLTLAICMVGNGNELVW